MNLSITKYPQSNGNNQIDGGIRQIWWTRLVIKQIYFILDLTVLIMSFILAYLLRFDFAIPRQDLYHGLIQLPYAVLIQFVTLVTVGVYAFIWRYVGMAEVKTFIKAALLSSLPLLLFRLGLTEKVQVLRIPLSVIVMDTLLGYGGVLGLRVMRRALYERYEKKGRHIVKTNGERQPVLLVGAGRAGVMAVKEILGRGDVDLEIRGFVDDDPNKQGGVIYGIKVLGTTRDLPRIVAEQGIRCVVISIVKASRKDFRRILDICEQIPVKVQVVPSLSEILQGRVKISRIRDVEIEDLLGREPVRLEDESMRRLLADKTVMVTGAGGSIGSELTRQIARFQPSVLLLVERSEFALFNIDRELRQLWPSLSLAPLIADISDESRMCSIFECFRPQVILHAAAHKHVPMMEANSTEAVKNNVLATSLLGDLAGKFGVETFVLISTDKAVRPTSIMGATKRVAELVIQALNQQYKTIYVAVRFGNVIGSTGSVIPLFREQIRQGGPVTVTHPDMMRYFMTIPEASQLVLQAGAMSTGGEIFILDMGEPVHILDLAKETITLSGLRPYEDIDIVFTGIRPGEKLFEELETTSEQVAKTRHPKIFIGKIAAYSEEEIRKSLERLKVLAEDGQEQKLREFLTQLLPEAKLISSTDRARPRLALSATSGLASETEGSPYLE